MPRTPDLVVRVGDIPEVITLLEKAERALVHLGQVRALIRDLEWGDTNTEPTEPGIDISEDACWICGRRRKWGHRPDCDLLPILAVLSEQL